MKINSFIAIVLLSSIISCARDPEATQNFSVRFNQLKPGKLTDRQTKNIWPGARLECGKKDFIFYKPGITTHPHFIAQENSNNYLKVFIPGNHYGRRQVTQHVKLNTPGKSNGILQAWFDGEEAFYFDTILFRKTKEIKTDRISYNVFMGGGDLSWAPANDQYICFDDFRVFNSNA